MSTDYRTASVIIALTDGELHEDLFYYAEREVNEPSAGGRCQTGAHQTSSLDDDFFFSWSQRLLDSYIFALDRTGDVCA